MVNPFRFSACARISLLVVAGLLALAPLALAEDEPTAPTQTPEGKTPGSKSPEAKPSETKPSETGAVKATKTAVLKVLGNGSEPRRVLAYAPAAGSTREFSTSDKTEVTHMMGQTIIGPRKSTVRVAFFQSTSEAGRLASAEITAASMTSEGNFPGTARMKEEFESSKGTKLSGSLSGCGVWTATPAEEKPTTTQSGLQRHLRSFFPLLPAEVMGVGAKWTTTVLLSDRGVLQTSVVTSEVTKIDGKRVELSVVETRSAKDQKINIMGQEVPIKSVTGGGKGSLVLDLELGGVVKSARSIKTEMVMFMMGSEMTSSAVIKSSVTSSTPDAAASEAK